MSMSADTPRDNLTLSEADLAACRPIVGEGGHVLRALCPFHGSDRQRSLRVQVHSDRFVCFACGAWGYLETARALARGAATPGGLPQASSPPAARATPAPAATQASQAASGSSQEALRRSTSTTCVRP